MKTTIVEHSALEMEQILQRELMTCPECGEEVCTRPAEGVPAQSLRSCVECGGVFVMEVDEMPSWEYENGDDGEDDE